MSMLSFVNQVSQTARWPRAVICKTWRRAVARYGARLKRRHLSLIFMSEAAVQKLNQTYRGKNCATNILSFPSSTPDELGDIIICPAIARREAAKWGRNFSAQINYLFIHGLLHLLGFDHSSSKDEKRMQKAEKGLR